MAEFKKMTVEALRDLARKVLGRGYTRLKTKAELVAALQDTEQKLAKVAQRAATTVKEATGRAARATERVAENVRRKRERRATDKAAKKAAPKRDGSKDRKGKASDKAARPPAPEAAKRKGRSTAPRASAEPDPEGYMVARVAGEDALRGSPHAMTESAVEEKRGGRRGGRARGAPVGHLFHEHLGELPWSYADDALTLLARDPTTLFLYWDHAAETLRQSFEGLHGGHAQIWLFLREGESWNRIRTIDFALESRSYYVHDLEPGRLYRAEIHAVDRRGNEKLIPRISNEMMLPPLGPSPVVEDRFMRLPWSEPLPQLIRDSHPGGPFPEDVRAQLARLSDWSQFAGRVWGGSAGGVGGRPFSPTSSPSAGPSNGIPRDPRGEGR